MNVEPLTPRVVVQRVSGGVEIVMPARRHLALIGFLGAWLVGWAVGETFAVRQLTSPPAGDGSGDPGVTIFLTAWLVGWTIGGAFALLQVLWMIAGRETVSSGQGVLRIQPSIFGIGPVRAYDIAHVTNLRPSTPTTPGAAVPFQPFVPGKGSVSFDYGGRTIQFGPSLDEAEARSVVQALKSAHEFRESA